MWVCAPVRRHPGPNMTFFNRIQSPLRTACCKKVIIHRVSTKTGTAPSISASQRSVVGDGWWDGVMCTLVHPLPCESRTKIPRLDGQHRPLVLKGGGIYQGQSRTRLQKVGKGHKEIGVPFFGTKSGIAQTPVVNSQMFLCQSGPKTSNLHCVSLPVRFQTLLPSKHRISTVLGTSGYTVVPRVPALTVNLGWGGGILGLAEPGF